MKKFLLTLLIIIIVTIIGGLLYYKNSIGPVSNSDKDVEFEVSENDTYYSIASKLKESELIKNENVYKIYIKLNKPTNQLKRGKYILKQNMGIEKIISVLSNSKDAIKSDIVITFKEGKNMRYIASIIAENTNNNEEDVYSLIKNQEYLKELINTYWFIDNSILNSNLYYSLEGYLYPDTYNFKNKDVTVKEIFKSMLDETSKKLEPLKDSIINSKYSLHQILTMASIVELEALKERDRAKVASVFYNRLNINMPLGSDVTTYYASKVDMSERDLTINELNAVNSYNTRSTTMAGKLPIGPICNPSISSINAALKPAQTDYYFFVADKDGNVYYTKTNSEHEQLIARLKSEGKWYTYQK